MNNRQYCKVVREKSKRFHSHQARIKNFVFDDGCSQVEFWSYSTPMIIYVDDTIFLNKKWYSSTTTRQVNRYCRENNINLSMAVRLSPDEIWAMTR